eukprot:TRINITY_DN25602_c0_g1_i1.p2 TRINITY_DN25602_c0_g1~~TRINITY_DN25602_c0_g1_i1.p2  ORF type:complete len:141 (+),score=19.24 TRINITY_DN25602_c0_g1_i1:64-423(+)
MVNFVDFLPSNWGPAGGKKLFQPLTLQRGLQDHGVANRFANLVNRTIFRMGIIEIFVLGFFVMKINEWAVFNNRANEKVNVCLERRHGDPWYREENLTRSQRSLLYNAAFADVLHSEKL